LYRPRVSKALAEALNYRLTILLAGAGYGKSTALAGLSKEFKLLIWYQVVERDSDPVIFLLHLCHATQLAFPDLEGLPIPFLEAWDGSQGVFPWMGVLDQYLNALGEYLSEPALLVLDDIPQAAGSNEIAHLADRLTALAPPYLHILMAGRPPLTLPNLTRWRLQGEVLTIEQALLAFNAEEIGQLFAQHFKVELTPEEIQAVLAFTEGWAIALQLIWQSMRSGSSPSLEEALSGQTKSGGRLAGNSRESLFAILAREVFEGQPTDVREFLLISATLREMTVEACEALRSSAGFARRDCAAMLDYLRRQELFVFEHSDGSLRYHHIFHEFLKEQASIQQRRDWHLRAAQYYENNQNVDQAVQHYLQAEAWEPAAALLEKHGANLVAGGRLDSLAVLIDSLPPEMLHQYPGLLFILGDLARLRSRFDEALGWYQQAEAIWRGRGQIGGVGRALRGQARVYLDTVNPSRAEELLEQAIRLSDGIDDRNAQVRLYELLAENKLNAGRVGEAEGLRLKADLLRQEGPSDSQLLFRVYLRTGKLEQARLGLEERAMDEQMQPVHTPRSHRETLLLLSLINAFLGRAEQAYQTAVKGTQRGSTLHSPFVKAVGLMRQGHALMLPDLNTAGTLNERYPLAIEKFEQAVEISRNLAVPRLRVEAYWGLCRAHGYQGSLGEAQQAAQDGLEIASAAGDEWIASLIRLAMGASLVLAGRSEIAEQWLGRALAGFQECSDIFGMTATRVWLCLVWFRQRTLGAGVERAMVSPRLAQNLPEALAACRSSQYDFLFTRSSLLGPPDTRVFVPLLLLARSQGWEANYITHLLDQMGLAEILFHPGYQLRVSTLGAFMVWRGDELIQPGQWRREKARQLFQLFLTRAENAWRGEYLEREQIMEFLWSDADPLIAQRNFKIALNTLYQTLEPEREPGSESAYIAREGTAYGLRSESDMWCDAEEFSRLVRQVDAGQEKDSEAMLEPMELAVQLYMGEYLPELRYETWAQAKRSQLATLFLQTAEKLAEIYLNKGRYEEVIALCQRMLVQDDCWERAYRCLMLAYYGMGDHGQMGRAYQRCVQVLAEELDVSPSMETQALYLKLTQRSLSTFH
jgi:DNA-binding SARP family transcriptional activator